MVCSNFCCELLKYLVTRLGHWNCLILQILVGKQIQILRDMIRYCNYDFLFVFVTR